MSNTIFVVVTDINETTGRSAGKSAKRTKLHDQLQAWREQDGADSMRPDPEFK